MLLQLVYTKTGVFQQSQNPALECYRITKTFPSYEKFAMVQQIRRAALSVHLNIAEGCSRKSSPGNLIVSCFRQLTALIGSIVKQP